MKRFFIEKRYIWCVNTKVFVKTQLSIHVYECVYRHVYPHIHICRYTYTSERERERKKRGKISSAFFQEERKA